jgi:plasmid maintenance system killer protein
MCMELQFKNLRLKSLCENRRKLAGQYSPQTAKKVTNRLNDLEAAACLDEMRNLPGQCEELTGNRKGTLSIRLSDGLRLIFEPVAETDVWKPDGGLDWKRVTAVRILEIVDYH